MSAAFCALLLEACLPGAFDDVVVDHGNSSAADAASETREDAGKGDAGSLSGMDAGTNVMDAAGPEDASKVVPFDAARGDAGSLELDAQMNGAPDGAADAGDASCGDLANDPNNCGQCGMRCVGPKDGYAMCRMSRCWSVVFVRGPSEEISFHGGDGGVPFSNQLCPTDEVLIGIQGNYVPEATYSMGVRCGRPKLSNGPAGHSVEIVDGYAAPTVGVGLSGMETPVPYDLRCGPGEAVTEVDITSWHYWEYPTIKDIAIDCSTVSVDSQRKVQLDYSDSYFTELDLSTGNNIETSLDDCGEGRVVVGFSGSAGAHIDNVRTQCASLSVQATTKIDGLDVNE